MADARFLLNHSQLVLASLAVVAAGCAHSSAPGRSVAAVKTRGYLLCGVENGVPGFANVDATGRPAGLDVDVCRVVSAAIFGRPDRVQYRQADSVDGLLHRKDVDLVSRRLTWSLSREGTGLLFGPVIFYDGQGFLVSKTLGVHAARDLNGVDVCVEAGTLFESHLSSYFGANGLTLRKTLLRAIDDIPHALAAGRCPAYTADVSELGALRSRLPNRDEFDVLPDQISEEPLAPVVRQEDLDLFQVLRWAIFATISAEQLGVESTNVDQMMDSRDPDVRRLLGAVAGNGQALGLDEQWAYHVIKTVGNYGEMFERNLGAGSPIHLERGLNRLWTHGGLIYAPPLR